MSEKPERIKFTDRLPNIDQLIKVFEGDWSYIKTFRGGFKPTGVTNATYEECAYIPYYTHADLIAAQKRVFEWADYGSNLCENYDFEDFLKQDKP